MATATEPVAEAAPSVLAHFPYPSFRPYQKEAILKVAEAFERGRRFVIIEVPTGGGKSGIAWTLANHIGRSYVVTAQKILQQQYIADFGATLVDLKGRNEYECWLANQDLEPGEELVYAHRGLCKQMGKSKLPECFDELGAQAAANLDWIHCPYFRRLREAQDAAHTLFNFSSFLFQANYAKQFAKRPLLIVDEAHNIEGQLMGFVEISLSDRDFRDEGVRFPKHETPEEYRRYFGEIGLAGRIRAKLAEAKAGGNPDAAEKWEKAKLRLNAFLDEMEKTEFVAEWKEHEERGGYRTVTLKPLYVRGYADRLLFGYGERVLLMSATILSHKVFCENLGIPIEDVEYVHVPCTFPVANRRIRLRYVGSMSFKSRRETLPLLVQKIEKALDLHAADRGIIHTHSFGITNFIRDNIARRYRGRLLFQEDFPDKDALLAEHARRAASVLVAPALHEGLDLKDDLSRFQLICKVPYPDANSDKQLKLRTKANWHYYLWLAALKLVQSYGRSIRSETDYAHTYILDSDFGKFVKMARKMLPAWFLDAILW